jgi:hypothetical protein
VKNRARALDARLFVAAVILAAALVAVGIWLVLSETRGTDWLRPEEASAAVDAGLAGLSLVLFDGDTGVRLPMIFGLACQLRPPAQP